jgi:hypothetical protein
MAEFSSITSPGSRQVFLAIAAKTRRRKGEEEMNPGSSRLLTQIKTAKDFSSAGCY